MFYFKCVKIEKTGWMANFSFLARSFVRSSCHSINKLVVKTRKHSNYHEICKFSENFIVFCDIIYTTI